MNCKVALITGVTGQDGSYLSELLLSKGYVVHGVKRRSSSFNTERLTHIFDHPRFHLHYGDVTDFGTMVAVVTKTRPDELYNLAAQSHVKTSFEMPIYTAQTDAIGTLHCLEAIRVAGLERTTRFYQASTSELYSSRETF